MPLETVIRIQGYPEKNGRTAFDPLTIHDEADNRLLKVNRQDEVHLHGVINQIRDLNLLILMKPIINKT